ncbi:hypothetical protein [Bacillus cereus]|uniref:hypothetical protein n=1 Tax=Bacillus cereus TaxID=1396 RepID=UPI000BEE4223|nr:hypothetical protein [Bacillus cereus]PDY82781.1 hypothetical protein CON06_10280 [Bacillus cereus]
MFICVENLKFKETRSSMDPDCFLLDLSIKNVIPYFLRLSMDRKTKEIIQIVVCMDESSNYFIESYDLFMDLSEEIQQEKEHGYSLFYSFIEKDAAVRMNLLFVGSEVTL